MNYLDNPYCHFTPITNFDMTKKKDIVSISLFKMRGGGYKNFDKYLGSLSKISDVVKRYDNLFIRLFVDKHVSGDKDIIKKLEQIERIQIVEYHCEKFVVDGYHVSTFGTIVRFFPMFKFPNNDADRVIVLDADVMNDLLVNVFQLFDDINKYDINDVYVAFGGRFNHLNARQIIPIEHHGETYIVPYCTASRIIDIKKIPPKYLTSFLETVIEYINAEKQPSVKLHEYPINKNEVSKKCDHNVCYGVDEYYLNKGLLKSLLVNDLPFCYKYNFDMANFYYYAHPKKFDEHKSTLSKKEYTKVFNDYMKKIGLDKYTYSEIDNNIYKNRQPKASEFMKKYAKSMGQLLKELYTKKDFRVFGLEQMYDFMSVKHDEYFYVNSIRFINSKRNDIIIKSIKL